MLWYTARFSPCPSLARCHFPLYLSILSCRGGAKWSEVLSEATMDLALDWALCGVDMFIEEATPASHSSSTWGDSPGYLP